MASSGFKVTLQFRNAGAFKRQAEKIGRGFVAVFEAIHERWLAHNSTKFEQGRGSELSGVAFDGEIIWQPDTLPYSMSKRRAGYDDWLMVKTGETMAALTQKNAPGEFHLIEPTRALFSVSDDPRDRVRWNWEKRPTIWLDEEDEQMIVDMFGAFMNDLPPFKAFSGMDTDRMDAEFGDVMNPLGFA